jgi:TatD DNase family protein
MLVDSHCHLDFDRFDRDRDAVVERARRAGVGLIVNPGYDLASSRRAVALAEQHAGIHAAVGVHPHQAKEVTAQVLADLRSLAGQPKVVAIGEIGLDFYRDLSPRDAQRRAFRAQLELAADLGLPVIVHSRSAHQEVMSILAEWAEATSPGFASPSMRGPSASGPSMRGVVHAFSGDRAMADRAFDLGFCVGVGGPVTFKNARGLQALVGALPLERLLIETDAPYLAPHPHRGQRNEPGWVALVAAAVAELHDTTPDVVARETTMNACRLFGLANDPVGRVRSSELD